MEFTMVINSIITLFSQAYSLIAVSVMVILCYFIIKESFSFAISHMQKYILYILIKPLSGVPVIGGLVDNMIDWIQICDDSAYDAYNHSVFSSP